MPDPADPTPVKAVQRGSSWSVVDKNGSQVKEGGNLKETAARALAATINSTWASAKKERVSKGGPAITEGRPGEKTLEVLESIVGMLSHWKAELHPRGRAGEFAATGRANPLTTHSKEYGRRDIGRGRHFDALKTELQRVRAARANVPARDLQKNIFEERRIMAMMHQVTLGKANQPTHQPQTLFISSGLLPRLEKELRGTPLADRARYALEDSLPRGGAQGKPSSPGGLRVDTPEELAHVRGAVERILPQAKAANDDLAWRPAERLLKKELAPVTLGKANEPAGWFENSHYRTFSDGGWSPDLSIAYDKNERPIGWGHEIEGMTQYKYDPEGAATLHAASTKAVAAGQAKVEDEPPALHRGKANTPVGNEPLLPGALTPGTEFVDLADQRYRVKGTAPIRHGRVKLALEQFTRGDWQPGGNVKYPAGEDQGFRQPLDRPRTAGVLSTISAGATGRSNRAVDPDGPYTIQVFGGDVGGHDLDFEADTLKDAIKIAHQEHPKGARETEVYDRHWNSRHTVSG